MGSHIRCPETDSGFTHERVSEWTLTILEIRLPFFSSLLPQTERPLPEDEELTTTAVSLRTASLERLLLHHLNQQSELRQDEG